MPEAEDVDTAVVADDAAAADNADDVDAHIAALEAALGVVTGDGAMRYDIWRPRLVS